jgi:hypothetical protein
MHKSHTKLSNQEFKIKQDWKNGMEDLLFGPWLLPARPNPKPKRRRADALSPSRPHRSRPQLAQRPEPLAGRDLSSPRTRWRQPKMKDSRRGRESEPEAAGRHCASPVGHWAVGAAVVSSKAASQQRQQATPARLCGTARLHRC